MTVKAATQATTCADRRQDPVAGLLDLPGGFPREPGDFAGRGAELEKLRSAILARAETAERSPVIAAVTGLPGVGKTTFALRLVRSLAIYRPEVLLYADARDASARAVPPTELLDRFLSHLGVPHDRLPIGYEDQMELCRSLMAGRRVVVLLDDVCDSVQVEAALPIGADVVMVLTGRRMPRGLEDALTLTLEGLDRASALALLTALVGPTRVACDPQAAQRLLDACDGNPQALRLAGTQLGHRPQWPMADYARALGQARTPAEHPEPQGQRGRIDAGGAASVMFGAELPVRTSADAAFLLGHRCLASASARMLRRLGELPGAVFTADLAARLAGLEPSDASTADAVQELVETGLIEAEPVHIVPPPAPGAEGAGGGTLYRMPGLVREHARLLFDREEPRAGQLTVRRALLDWYLAAAAQGSATHAGPWPGRDGEYGLALVRIGAAHRLDAPAARLATALCRGALAGGGRPRRLRELIGLWLTVTRRLDDRAGQAEAHAAWGTLRARQGQPAEAAACYRTALAIRRDLGDVPGQARLMANLGSVHADLDDPDRAAEWYQRAMALHREGHDRAARDAAWEARLWARLGAVRVRQRRLDEGLRCFRTALDGYRRQNDEIGTARTLADLGVVLDGLGRAEEAVRHYRFAVEAARAAGAGRIEAHALLLLATALEAAGESSSSEVYRRDAEAVLARLGPVGAVPSPRRAGEMTDAGGLAGGHAGGTGSRTAAGGQPPSPGGAPVR